MRLVLAAILSVAATAPLAEPLRYRLDTRVSDVAFTVDMNQSPLRGHMPVTDADLILDFDRAAASRVRVTLAPSDARMSLPFATQAMKDPTVLDTAEFPEIRFESTSFVAQGQGARVEGRLTVRGVTRPVTLQAQIYRPRGSAPGERRQL